MRRFRIPIVLIGVVALSSLISTPASANAGTPLLWVSMLHLIVGNAFIGLFEGLIISRIFRIKYLRSALWMVLGNYVSFIIGYLILYSEVVPIHRVNIMNTISFMLFSIILIVMITMIIEFPFCFILSKNQANRIVKSLKATIIVQISSYVLIILVYLPVSDISFLTNLNNEKALNVSKNNDCMVYYIADNGSVYRIRANGEDKEKVHDGKIENKNAKLYFERLENDELCDLRAVHDWQDETEVLAHSIECESGLFINDPEKGPDTWMGTGDVSFIEKGSFSASTGFWAGYWPGSGLNILNEDKGISYHLRLETPVISSYIKNAHGLRNNQLLFQTKNQIYTFRENNKIYLLDMEEKKISLIANGRGPTVVCNNK